MTEFAQGSLSCSSNWVTRKDGTRHKASPHYKYERMGKDERKREFPGFDGRLRDAVTDDMSAYVGDALAAPQRRMRLRHHRQAALCSMRTAAMDAYFSTN